MEATAISQDRTPWPEERDFLVCALLEVGERESRRMGQELHDHLCQVLMGAAFAAKAVTLELPSTSPAAVELNEVVRLISSAAQEAREIARGLNPVGLDAAGLVPALQQLVAHPRGTFTCTLTCPRTVILPDARTALHLYRIAQEAIANAVQHSGGTNAVVRLTGGKDGIHLQISDDGHGFEREAMVPPGLGLPIMKYRAEAINARLRFDTREGGGTNVSCSLPLTT